MLLAVDDGAGAGAGDGWWFCLTGAKREQALACEEATEKYACVLWYVWGGINNECV